MLQVVERVRRCQRAISGARLAGQSAMTSTQEGGPGVTIVGASEEIGTLAVMLDLASADAGQTDVAVGQRDSGQVPGWSVNWSRI